MQQLVNARIHGEKWNLVPMRVIKRDHAQMKTLVASHDTTQAPPVIPLGWHPVSNYQIDHVVREFLEHRSAARRTPDVSYDSGAVELNTAAAKIARCLRPHVRESSQLPFKQFRATIHNLLNRNSERPILPHIQRSCRASR
jgi:hypothetical protein